MSSAQGANPEYVNARIRARRAKLFDEEDYREISPGPIRTSFR